VLTAQGEKMNEKLSILVIDDRPAQLQDRIKLLPNQLRHGVVVCDPEGVTSSMLDEAKLVLVDYKFDNWVGIANERVLSRRIPNGLALTAILQQHAMQCPRPTAFAIYSEYLGELTAPFKPGPRVHLLVHTCNLEWAFVTSSQGAPTKTFEDAHIIANAVGRLPKVWPQKNPEKARQIARKLLSIPAELDWTEQAWQDAEMARPPLDEMTLRIHGLLFLRRLLTRVLYYPCFLVDRYWLAARLGANPESVDSALSEKPTRLAKLFAAASYAGILENLPGRRWWRAGIESIIWDIGGGESLGTEDLQKRLREKHKIDLIPTQNPYPVVCLDGDYKPLSKLYPADESVRLQLDDWPGHADPPRTTIQMANDDDRLGALVIPADRDRLGT
jgi:hypothetical protein